MKNCEISPLYGKDNDKNLYFYCEYCEKEMGYNEVRECNAKIEKCECGEIIGTSGKSMGKCFKCNKNI